MDPITHPMSTVEQNTTSATPPMNMVESNTVPETSGSSHKKNIFIFLLLISFISAGALIYVRTKPMQPYVKPAKTTEAQQTSTSLSTTIPDTQAPPLIADINKDTMTIPDLSSVTNERAKEIITEYFTTVKPERDELRNQIPGGVVVFKNGKANISDELAKKWSENTKKYASMSDELATLSEEVARVMFNPTMLAPMVRGKIYINDALVYINTEANATSLELQSSTSYAKYIASNKTPSLYVLKKGNNTVRVEYTLDATTLGPDTVTTLDEPITVTIKEIKMAADKNLEEGATLLTLQEKPITYKNGTFSQSKGTLAGNFLIK